MYGIQKDYITTAERLAEPSQLKILQIMELYGFKVTSFKIYKTIFGRK